MPLVSCAHGVPAVVQSPVALVAAGAGSRPGKFPPVPHGLADAVGGPVVPRGLDQQAPQVGVARLGDRPLGP